MSFKQFFKGFRKGMSRFGDGIAIIVNSALLSLVYLIGVGITSLIAKLAGKHFLEMKRSRKIQTYWSDLHLKKKDEDSYYRQY